MTEETENIITACRCKHCGTELSAGAKICPKCRYSQKSCWYFFERMVQIVSIVSVGMLIISAATLISSCSQEKKSQAAVNRAEEANKKIDTIYMELKAKSDSVTFYIDGLKQQQYINTLGARAISFHDRNAYDELTVLIDRSSNNSNLISTRNQVVLFWLTLSTPLGNYRLQLPVEGDTATIEQNLQIITLAKILFYRDNYEDRIKAAILLGEKENDKNVGKILLIALFGDNDIEVALRCRRNLSWLIGYEDEEFLDTDKIFTYWKKENINLYKIENSYKELLTQYKNELTKRIGTSKNKYEIIRLRKTIALVKSFI